MKPLKESEDYVNDLQAAYDYYKYYGPLTAGRFLAAYEAAEKIIGDHPYVCRARRHGWRQMVIKRHSSYSIFYKEFPDFWLLGGVLSTLGDPDAIQARLLIREVRESPGKPS